MVTKTVSLLLLAVLCLALHPAEGRASLANETEHSTITEKEAPLASKDGGKVAGVGAVRVAGAGEHEEEEEELEETGDGPAQYPFRDLPADVLRDFPGLCFGSTALRLFQVGQSWSLTPFCGVATCLVGRDAYGNRFIERVQDCGPQPKRNPKCKNVNAKSQAQFPLCCPQFECEEGVELEYPTQEELQQLAHEAAQAAVRAQYDGLEQGQEEDEPVGLSGRKTPTEEPAEYDEPAVTEPETVKPKAVVSEPAKEKPAAEAPKKKVPS